MIDRDLMTIEQAAKYLGRSNSTVRTLVDTRRLPHVIDPEAKQRQGRRLIPRSAVMEYAEKRGITPLDNR
jgi:excisionase family DNA binding protein